MVFAKTDKAVDKSTILYNSKVRLTDIPLEAYEYVVNGKPAIEWVMERYQVTVDKDSGIRNDPNAWSVDPRYIIDLVKRVVRVSVETVSLVRRMPAYSQPPKSICLSLGAVDHIAAADAKFHDPAKVAAGGE